MRRDVPPGPKSSDSEIRQAVEAAARRAGLTPSGWLDRIEAEARRPERTSRASRGALDDLIEEIARSVNPRLAGGTPATPPLGGATQTARALDSAAAWIEQAGERFAESREREDRLAETLSHALLTLEDRLAGIERREAESTPTLPPPALAALEAVERELAALRGNLGAIATQAEVASLNERLAARIDRLAEAGSWREPLADLARQVGNLRQDLAQGIGLPRVERLAAEMASLNRRIGELQAQQVGAADMAALAEVLNEIRSSLARSDGKSADQLDSVSRRLDHLTGSLESAGLEQMTHRLAALATAIEELGQSDVRSAEAVAARVDRRLADFAEHFDALARVGATSAQSLADQLHEESTRVIGPMRSLSERLADLDRRLETLPADLNRPVKLAGERLGKLATHLEALANAAEPLTELGERMDRRLDGLAERLEALAASAAAHPDQAGETSAELRSEIAALIADNVAPVRTAADRVERLAGEMGALVERAGVAPGPLLDRLDRLEDSVRELGEHSDTLPLELMIRSLQERIDRLAPGSASVEGIQDRLTGIVERLNLTPAEPVQQALGEALAHLRGLRSEAAMIAERAAKAALKEAPLAMAADIEAVRQGVAELKTLQASAEKKTQATLKAVHNALETLVMRMPPGVSIVPTPSAPPADSPAVRLEAAVRKLHAAALAHAEDVTASPAGSADEVLLDPSTPRNALVPAGASFTAPQEGAPGAVRASFIAAARRAAHAATAEAEAGATEETPASGRAPISNQTLIERIRQTFDGHRRPLLFGAALLLAAGSVPAAQGLRGDPGPALAPPKVDAAPGAAGAGSEMAAAPVLAPMQEAAVRARLEATTAVLPAGAIPGAAKVLPAADFAPSELPTAVPASLKEAVLAGNPAALYDVAARLEEARDVPRDLALAAQFYEAAAEAGLAPAQFRLAHLHDRGAGVPKDPALARRWYERAAAAGHVQAMHNLGVLLAEGRDGKPDYAAAVQWFREASEHGLRDSQFNLAVLLARGVGARQDLGQSYTWFALAAAEGDDDARRKRDEVAARLAPADLAGAKRAVAAWRPRPVKSAANEVAPPAEGWTAAGNRSMSDRS